MGKPGLITTIREKLHDENHWLTRRKLVITGITLILVGILLGLFESSSDSERASRPAVIDIPLPERAPKPGTEPAEKDATAGLPSAPGETDWTSVTVKK